MGVLPLDFPVAQAWLRHRTGIEPSRKDDCAKSECGYAESEAAEVRGKTGKRRLSNPTDMIPPRQPCGPKKKSGNLAPMFECGVIY
jgi:hypothetical protein